MQRLADGSEPIPNSDGTRHHYVPQSTLRRFRSSARHGRKLFQLDKVRGECVEVKPKEVGWEDGLYSVESLTGSHNGMVEALFAQAENYASTSIQRLLKQPNEFTPTDRSNIAHFTALQGRRTPSGMNELNELANQMTTALKVVEMNNVGGSKKKKALAAEAKRKLLSGTIEIEVPRQNILLLMIEGFVQVAQLVEGMSWALLRPTEGHFICSDGPLTMKDPTPKQPWSGVGWQSSEQVFATLPLSAKGCLRFAHVGAPFSDRRTEGQVELTNRRTYGWATRYVFGPSQEYLEDLYSRAQEEPDQYPPQPKARNVIMEDAETADPRIAKENAERGWAPYMYAPDENGVTRKMSYEVIDSMDDLRAAVQDGDDEAQE